MGGCRVCAPPQCWGGGSDSTLPYLPRCPSHHHLGRVLAQSNLLHPQAWVITVGIKAAHLWEERRECGAEHLDTTTGQPPMSPPPAAGYRLQCMGCSRHDAWDMPVPTCPRPLHWGRPTRQGPWNKHPLLSPWAVTQQLRPEMKGHVPGAMPGWLHPLCLSMALCVPALRCWGGQRRVLGCPPCGRAATPPRPPG